MPAEAEGANLRSEDMSGTILPLVITKVPKATADASKFTKVYTIDLAKFGIRNDGTDADATSKGLNEALQEAKTVKANRIVFPPGKYLISENAPIVLDHQDTIVDLNGATLQVRANGKPNYEVVRIVNGAKNFRLTNGTICGDRDEHDYKTTPGTHEGGACLYVFGGENLEIDHLTLTKGSGDGLTAASLGSTNRDELLARIYETLGKRDIETGAFSDKGEKVESATKMRTVKPYKVGGDRDRFEVGYTAGYYGFPSIKGRAYQAYFFDENNRFLEKKNCLQYRKIEVPAAAKYVHFEFNQSGIEVEEGKNPPEWYLRMTKLTPSTDVHFHHNVLVENRRLGMANVGQRWLIEENRFERNGGTAPAYGMDLEDGWELMQDIVIRKNTFKDNKAGDLVICAGSEILVEDNDFQKSVVLYGRVYNYTAQKNRYDGGTVYYATRTGVATIKDNLYKGNKRVSIIFDGKGVADGLVRKAGEAVATPPLVLSGEKMESVGKVEGTYLNFNNSTFRNTKFEAGEPTRMIQFNGCTFDGSSLKFLDKGSQVMFKSKSNKGNLQIDGPGLSRKIEK